MVRKKNKFSSVGIYYSLTGSKIEQIASQIHEILNNSGIRVLFAKQIGKSIRAKKSYSDQYIVNNSDFIISIGGDGTLLSCARKFGYRGIPILGINLGTLGFLTDVQPEEMTTSLVEILEGKYTQDKRFFLEAKVNSSKKTFIALNEAVVHSGSVAKLIEYDLFIDNDFVYKQKADGIIIGTPTGSTAYSLSGNGPIIHPSLGSISLLPMFPHSLSARPLLINKKSIVRIVLNKKSNAKLSMDSHNLYSLKGGDVIELKKSKPELVLLHPDEHNFYNACRTKLGWSLDFSSKEL